MKRITFTSVAEEDAAAAVLFYNERQVGLGVDFIDALRSTLRAIQENPELWAFIEKPFRSCRMHRFPFRVLFQELPDRIQIVAVAHLSRRPGYWKTGTNQ